MVVKSYGRNKNLETKKQFRKQLEASKVHKKTVISAEAITFCNTPLTRYLPRSDLKIGEIWTTVTNRN